MKQHLRLTVYNPLLPLFREHMFKHSILFNHQLNVLLSNLSSYLRCWMFLCSYKYLYSYLHIKQSAENKSSWKGYFFVSFFLKTDIQTF